MLNVQGAESNSYTLKRNRVFTGDGLLCTARRTNISLHDLSCVSE